MRLAQRRRELLDSAPSLMSYRHQRIAGHANTIMPVLLLGILDEAFLQNVVIVYVALLSLAVSLLPQPIQLVLGRLPEVTAALGSAYSGHPRLPY